jgi:predicted amidohydrolase
MITRCLENNVFAVTANRFSEDKRPHGSIRFTGKSQIVAPKGRLIYRAPAQRRVLQLADIDPREADDKMITTTNHLLKDRRKHFYDSLI